MLRVMSTFSGISAASVAWKPLRFTCAAYAEITSHACYVLHERCGASRPRYMPQPDEPGISEKDRKARLKAVREVAELPETGIPNLGDISQITDADLEALGPIDLLEGGSPCQAFSVAGARGGLSDQRGNLLLEFCNLAKRMRRINGTRYVIWENVPGVLSDATNGFGCLLGSLAGSNGPLVPSGRRWFGAGCAVGPEACVSWRVLDAQFFGVPQRRKRVFVVADFGDRDGSSGAVLFEPQGKRRDHPEGFWSGEGAAEKRARSPISGNVIALGMDSKDSIAIDRMHALKASNGHNPPAIAYSLCDDYTPKAAAETAYTLLAGSPTGGGHKQLVVHPKIVGTLCASGAGKSRPAGQGNELDFVVCQTDEARRDWIVRRLMPVEAERLQGFPDGWTAVALRGKPMADGPRYKALGNSMAVPCMRFIGSRLLQYHNEQIMNETDLQREAA